MRCPRAWCAEQPLEDRRVEAAGQVVADEIAGQGVEGFRLFVGQGQEEEALQGMAVDEAEGVEEEAQPVEDLEGTAEGAAGVIESLPVEDAVASQQGVVEIEKGVDRGHGAKIA